MSHGSGRFLVVRGPDVDDQPAKRHAQGIGAGETPHQRDAGLFQQGDDLDRGRRAHIAEQAKDLVFNKELLGIGHATRRIVTVVQGNDANGAAMHPAGRVDALDIGHGPGQGLAAEIPGMAGQGQGRAHGHGRVGHARRRLGDVVGVPVPGASGKPNAEKGKQGNGHKSVAGGQVAHVWGIADRFPGSTGTRPCPYGPGWMWRDSTHATRFVRTPSVSVRWARPGFISRNCPARGRKAFRAPTARGPRHDDCTETPIP